MAQNQFGTSPLGTTFSADPVYDTAGLITAIMRASGQSTQDTSSRARILEFVNSRYIQILKGRHWRFMQRQLTIDLLAPYTTGTVAATNGDGTITGTSTVFDSTMLNQKMVIGTTGTGYRVLSVDSATSIELVGKWAEDTTSSATYEILRDVYSIPQDIAGLRSVFLAGVGELECIGIEELHYKEQQQPGLSGVPRYCSIRKQENEGGTYELQFYPAPDRDYNCIIDYTLRPNRLVDADDCKPLIPDYHMDVLFYAVLADIYRFHADPVNSESAKKDAILSFNRMAGDHDVSDSVTTVKPRRNYWNRIRRGRHRGYYGNKYFGWID